MMDAFTIDHNHFAETLACTLWLLGEQPPILDTVIDLLRIHVMLIIVTSIVPNGQKSK